LKVAVFGQAANPKKGSTSLSFSGGLEVAAGRCAQNLPFGSAVFGLHIHEDFPFAALLKRGQGTTDQEITGTVQPTAT
jgi:hypothetical protein